MIKPLIIGIAGGSGSGKTTFSKNLIKCLSDYLSDNLSEKQNSPLAAILGQDSYYKDQSHRFDRDGGAVNFDHPDAIDFDLLLDHLQQLKSGRSIEVPLYDFATHKRLRQTHQFSPQPIIIVDGILIYTDKRLINEFDYKLFIDCPEQVRFDRRLKRDVQERGRTESGVKDQIRLQVKPMHDEFVEPSKVVADDLIHQEQFHSKNLTWCQTLFQLSQARS